MDENSNFETLKDDILTLIFERYLIHMQKTMLGFHMIQVLK